MAIEVAQSTVPCCKCGRAYKNRRGFFPVSYAVLHKGLGYLPFCKDCVDKMYNDYLIECGNSKDACRQVCRKLDLYWNDAIFAAADKRSTARTMMSGYITKINTVAQSGKSYDDTLREEGTFWKFVPEDQVPPATQPEQEVIKEEETVRDEREQEETVEVPDSVMAFWGTGFKPGMYIDLEQRRKYWMAKFKSQGVELDVGTEALLRQICIMEITINQDRASGRSIDKNVNALNNLLGSASLKPAQKKEDTNADAALASTPLGVWLYRYEQKRPLPEIDDDMKDVNGIRKYVFTWMGHLCKMLGIKNGYADLYEKEIARLRVERPEYDGEDDEAFMSRLFEEEDGYDEGTEEPEDED